jgi:hypothetical protein
MSYDYEGNNQFPIAVTLPDDGDTPGQTTFAPGWEGNRDAVVYLLKRATGPALYNFHSPVTPAANYSWTSFVWDDQTATTGGGGSTLILYARWLAVQNSTLGLGCQLLMSLDGRTWLNGPTTATTATVALANSLCVSGNIASAFTTNSKVVYFNIGSGAASITASAGWNATQGCAWDNRTTAKGYFVGATQSGGTFTGAAASATAAGVIVNLSGSLPAGWASGTNHVGNFRYATNDTTYVVLMCGVTPGTDTARLLNASVIAGSADITPSVLTNKIGVGIAYDVLTNLWVLCAADTGATYFYTSPDLIAWTLAQHLGGTNPPHAKEFAVVNGMWALVQNDYQGAANSSTIYLSSSDGDNMNRSQTYVSSTTPTFAAGKYSMIFGDAITYGVAISQAMSMA